MIIPLVTLVMVSMFWNLRQQRIIAQEHLRAVAAEQADAARVREKVTRDEERAKRNAAWAASDARVQQLYREITNLSQINERLVAEPRRSTPRKVDEVGDASDSP